MKSNNSHLLSFLKEVAIVVIGVLIAVSIGNFKEQRDNEAYIEKTLSAIGNEIEQSETEIKDILERHYVLFDSLKLLMENEEETLGELIGRLGGVQSPDIKNIGLRFFISNKAELLDYQIISQLYDIEEYTNSLDRKMDLLIEFAYESVNRRDKDNKLRFTYYLANVIESEKALLELYAKFREENDIE